MLKISESALTFTGNLLSKKGREIFGPIARRTKSPISAKSVYQHRAGNFEPTQVIARNEHPLVGFKDNATRGIVPKKKGLIGKPMQEMHDWHKKPVSPNLDPKSKFRQELHPTEPTTDTVDWQHKKTPTMATYRRIKGAIARVG